MWAKPKKMLLSYADAYNFSLDRLADRDHSSAELTAKLKERGCSDEMVERVLTALRSHHFIDDERCAGYVVDAWRRKKYYGRQYLRLMFSKRMIPQDIAERQIEEITEAEERERAEALARQQVPKLRRKYADESRKGKAALARMLASRGFTTGVIAETIGFYDDTAE
jgi:regulatory protein